MKTRTWTRRLAGATGTALAFVAVTVAVDVAPAYAIDAGGPIVVDESTGWFNTPDYKSEAAYCPDNTELIGTGASGASANTVVDEIIPHPDYVSGYMYEDGNKTNVDSQLTVRAICADVPGYEIVEAESLDDGLTPKSVVASCSDTAKDLLGTGYQIWGGGGEVTVTGVVPYAGTAPTKDSVTVTANEDDDYSSNGSWHVIAYAICGNLPDETVVQSSATSRSSNGTQGKSQTCPSDRYNTGGGTYAHLYPRDLHPSPFMPAEHYNGVDLVNGSTYEDDDGTPNAWYMTLYAICAVL